MKEIILRNYKTIIVIFIIVTLFIVSYVNLYISKIQAIDSLKQELNKMSDEEDIINRIKFSKEKINNLEIQIKSIEEQKMIEEAKTKCLKQQLDRLVEGLEYSIEYCDNNLNKFMGL